MSRLEVQESPVDVTKREKLSFRFKLAALLDSGVIITQATVRLVDELSGSDVQDVISNVVVVGNEVRCKVDFANNNVRADSDYLLFCKVTLSTGDEEEVFARFRVFGL